MVMVRLSPVWMTNHPPSVLETVGWVIRPVKTVGRITYIVLVQSDVKPCSILKLSIYPRVITVPVQVLITVNSNSF